MKTFALIVLTCVALVGSFMLLFEIGTPDLLGNNNSAFAALVVSVAGMAYFSYRWGVITTKGKPLELRDIGKEEVLVVVASHEEMRRDEVDHLIVKQNGSFRYVRLEPHLCGEKKPRLIWKATAR